MEQRKNKNIRTAAGSVLVLQDSEEGWRRLVMGRAHWVDIHPACVGRPARAVAIRLRRRWRPGDRATAAVTREVPIRGGHRREVAAIERCRRKTKGFSGRRSDNLGSKHNRRPTRRTAPRSPLSEKTHSVSHSRRLPRSVHRPHSFSPTPQTQLLQLAHHSRVLNTYN
jgi:hypothetical protein